MMQSIKKRIFLPAIILIAAIAADQIIKFAVKLSMFKHESIRVFDWFYIYFVENKGMAFGMELFDKVFLTGFRMVAVVFICYYLFKIIKNLKFPIGYILCVAFVLAGAIGNLIDSMIYGEIFTDSDGRVAELVPFGEGYGQFLHGQVVDMFYFPLFQWNSVPSWLDFLVDHNNYFFGAIFNLADSYICVAAVYMILFQWKAFDTEE